MLLYHCIFYINIIFILFLLLVQALVSTTCATQKWTCVIRLRVSTMEHACAGKVVIAVCALLVIQVNIALRFRKILKR